MFLPTIDISFFVKKGLLALFTFARHPLVSLLFVSSGVSVAVGALWSNFSSIVIPQVDITSLAFSQGDWFNVLCYMCSLDTFESILNFCISVINLIFPSIITFFATSLTLMHLYRTDSALRQMINQVYAKYT